MRMTKLQEKKVKKLLTHLNGLVEYWEKEERDSESKLKGLLFSILVMLDGGDTKFNGFKLIEKYTDTDVSIGYLHEIFGRDEYQPKKKKK